MNIKIILACTKDGGIGLNGEIPWYFPEDLSFFKKMTNGKTVVMGRKTFESLPIKPLPNRKNIVITRDKNKLVDFLNKIIVIESFDKLEEYIKYSSDEIFIIGGKDIYEYFFDKASEIYVTLINRNYETDVKVNIFPYFEKYEKIEIPTTNEEYSRWCLRKTMKLFEEDKVL